MFTTGKNGAEIIVVYGPEGVGKTTFGVSAPAPVVLGPENGLGDLVNVIPQKVTQTFAEVAAGVAHLANEKHEFKTLVVDTINGIEQLIHADICADQDVSNIELAFGGYGKGYIEAQKRIAGLMASLKALRDKKNMTVIIVGHSMVKTFNDPTLAAPYDRYMLKMNEKGAAIVREAVECVFFLNYKTYVKEEKGKKAKAFSDDARALHTRRTAAYDAKNRWSLPAEILLGKGNGWTTYQEARALSNAAGPAALQAEIAALVARLPSKTGEDKALIAGVQKHLADIGADVPSLKEAKNRLGEILSQN